MSSKRENNVSNHPHRWPIFHLGLAGLAVSLLVLPSWAGPNSDLPTVASDTAPSSDNSASRQDTVAVNRSNVRDAGTPRFACQMWAGQYTVMYQPESQPGEAYPWATPRELGGGWDSTKRCAEISRRLEEYRPDGLKELRTATENGYNTVCVTTDTNGSCRIVFTVPPGQDPVTTRDSVFRNLSVADGGQMTEGVNTLVGNQSNVNLTDDLVNLGLSVVGGLGSWSNPVATQDGGINLKPFLAPADGGTGVAMNNSVPIPQPVSSVKSKPVNQPSGLTLDPQKFR
jgi:Circadian oscillating protein COP23